MKKSGNVTEFAAERVAELSRLYDQVVSHAAGLKRPPAGSVYARLAALPASRFWVSEERAASVVSAILRGKDPCRTMRPPKQRMFSEIARRVIHARERHPHLPLVELVSSVIHAPAPEQYLTPAHARWLLHPHGKAKP